MATTTTQDADQRKAEILSSILFLKYGVIDSLKMADMLSRMQIKNVNGRKQFVRPLKTGNSTIDKTE